MGKSWVIYIILFSLPIMLLGQPRVSDCAKIKTGTFYFYPHKSDKGYVIIRDNMLQEEVNMKSSDTSFWKIRWLSGCEFDLEFLRRTQPMLDSEKRFYNQHITVVKIVNIADSYYTFKAGLDSITNNNNNNLVDTIWFKAR
jgi:hypothetical protein